VPPPGTRIDHDPMKYLDERDKVAALARMHPALDVRFLAPEREHPLAQDDTRLFARASMPILGPANLGVFGFMTDAVAADGHRTMLVGDVGNFGLTWAGYFSLLALLRGGRLAAFARDLTVLAHDHRRGLAKTFAGEVVMPAVPAALRQLINRLRGRAPDDVAHYSALNPAFIAEHDLTRHWREQGFDPWFGLRGWNPAQHRARFLFDHNQLARDYRGMSDELYGVETRDPHGDRRLLEFLLAVPEPLYRRNGVPRSFARAVLADRLPPEILHERRRGLQGVTWFRNLNARRNDVAAELERLEASPLASRLIDLPRLKRFMQQWPEDENAAEKRRYELRLALTRGVHVGRFIRWVEGGNA
jgi:asparagine synthase (glutamine-hydrolysing)